MLQHFCVGTRHIIFYARRDDYECDLATSDKRIARFICHSVCCSRYMATHIRIVEPICCAYGQNRISTSWRVSCTIIRYWCWMNAVNIVRPHVNWHPFDHPTVFYAIVALILRRVRRRAFRTNISLANYYQTRKCRIKLQRRIWHQWRKSSTTAQYYRQYFVSLLAASKCSASVWRLCVEKRPTNKTFEHE